jgi:hypothetical protein
MRPGTAQAIAILLTALPAGSVAQDVGKGGIAASFEGHCRFRIVQGFQMNKKFASCGSRVMFMNFRHNGRSFYQFFTSGPSYAFSGGSDRQPNLENYYLSIDHIRVATAKNANSEVGADTTVITGMEGECHLRWIKEGTRAYELKCDVYNRETGSMFNFYLEKIKRSEHKQF